MRRPSLVATALAALPLTACAPAVTVAPSVTIGRPVPVVVEPAPAPTTQALVWTAPESGEPTTWWIAPTAGVDGGAGEVGEVSGVLVAAGADVWRWRTEEVKIPTERCEQGIEAGEGRGMRAFVERVGSSERIEIAEVAKEPGANQIDQAVAVTGSVGPYLFVRETLYTYTCGAHGGSMASATVWDLEKRKAGADLLSDAERAALDSHERDEARAKLPAFDQSLTLEDVQYQASLPRYGSRGELGFEHAFSTFACYACSDGEWGSYSTSIRVPARHVPERFAGFAKAPAVVGAWLAAHPGVTLAGWSDVSADAARVLATIVTPRATGT